MSPPLPSQYPGRGYHNWGRPLPPCPQALWARRSSWNSLGGCRPCASSSQSASPVFTPASARSFYGYGLAGLGGVVGGSLRVRGPRASSSPRRHHHLHLHHLHHHGNPDEEESLLQPPVPPLPGHFVHRRDRRALSLELPNLLQVPGGGSGGPPHPPPIPANHLLHPMMFHVHQRKKSFSGGGGGGVDGLSSTGAHQDCNGKTPLSQLLQPPGAGGRRPDERGEGTNPQLIADVYPQVNNRGKEREDLDDEIDYVSRRRRWGGLA